MKGIEEQLRPEMMEILQGQSLVTVHVYDPELNTVISSGLSWVFAIDEKTIRLAVDHKSKLVDLAKEEIDFVLNFISKEGVYSINGISKVRVEKTETITLKMALIEVSVKEVRDITFYGAKITQRPEFIKTYNEKLAVKLDNEIEEAVRSL